jgi:ceramide glucosyltransferase
VTLAFRNPTNPESRDEYVMITIALAVVIAALFVRVLTAHVRMVRTLALPPGARAVPSSYPSVTLIRPIKGMDVGCRENTEALLAQDYPGEVETLFVFDSASDPAYPLVSALAEASGKNARVVFAGARPARRTGKLNAMISAFAQAHGELVAFCDSDSRPTPGLLRELVDELLADSKRGATFAPAVTQGSPSSFAEVVYGLMINSWYGAAAAEMAGAKRELPFIMGQIMLIKRQALTAIGGLESAEGQLVDDMFLGAEFHNAGYTNVMVRSPLHLVTGPLDLGELTKLLRKWMTFSRSGLPEGFVHRNILRGVDLGLALGSTVLALALDAPLLAAFAALTLAFWIYSQVSLYRRLTGFSVPLRFGWWVPVVAPFLAGFLLATSRLNRTVEWRGQSYQLNGSARLASPASGEGRVSLTPALSASVARVRSSVAPAAPRRSSMLPL